MDEQVGCSVHEDGLFGVRMVELLYGRAQYWRRNCER